MHRPLVVRNRPERDEYWFREGCHVTELSNSGDDEALSVAHIRVEPGGVTRWHALDDIVERYVILAGQGEVELGDEPARTVSVHDVVVIPPGCPQRIRNTGPAELLFLALCTPRFTPQRYLDLEDESLL